MLDIRCLRPTAVAVACFGFSVWTVIAYPSGSRKAKNLPNGPSAGGRRDGYAFFHQFRVERIGIHCGDPKRHTPSQLASCIEVNHGCPDRKRDRFGVEDNRARWIVRECSETDLLYVEGFGSLKVAYLERNKAWPDQFWRNSVLAGCYHGPYNI